MLEQNRGKEEAKTTWENNEDTLYQVPFPNSPDKKKKCTASRVIYDGSDSPLTVRASGESFRKETNGNPFTLRSVSESKRKRSKYAHTHTHIYIYKYRRIIVLTELFIKILLLKKKRRKLHREYLRNTYIIEIIDIIILHVCKFHASYRDYANIPTIRFIHT